MEELKITKVITVGDLHGKTCWKEIDPNKWDKIIFVGDYVDSFYEKDIDILNNLADIIAFKKAYPDKVELLWGNHDLMYLNISDGRFMCSGYRPGIGMVLHLMFEGNKDLFKNAYQIQNTIWSHAGIQNNWFINRFKGDVTQSELFIADQLNHVSSRDQALVINDVGYRRGGSNTVGGIFWCDREELQKPLIGFNQVVGHTAVKKIMTYEYKGNFVKFVDCLDKEIDFLELEFYN